MDKDKKKKKKRKNQSMSRATGVDTNGKVVGSSPPPPMPGATVAAGEGSSLLSATTTPCCPSITIITRALCIQEPPVSATASSATSTTPCLHGPQQTHQQQQQKGQEPELEQPQQQPQQPELPPQPQQREQQPPQQQLLQRDDYCDSTCKTNVTTTTTTTTTPKEKNDDTNTIVSILLKSLWTIIEPNSSSDHHHDDDDDDDDDQCGQDDDDDDDGEGATCPKNKTTRQSTNSNNLHCWIAAHDDDIQLALSHLAAARQQQIFGPGNEAHRWLLLLSGIQRIVVAIVTHYINNSTGTTTSGGGGGGSDESATAAAAAAAAATRVKLQTLLDFLAFGVSALSTKHQQQQQDGSDENYDHDDALSDEAEEEQEAEQGQERNETTLMHVLQTFELLLKKIVTATTSTALAATKDKNDDASLLLSSSSSRIMLLLPLLLSNLVKIILPWSILLSTSTTTATTTTTTRAALNVFFQYLPLVQHSHFPALIHDLVTYYLLAMPAPLSTESSSSLRSQRSLPTLQQQEQQRQDVALVTALRKEFAQRQEQPSTSGTTTTSAAEQQQQHQPDHLHLVSSAMLFLPVILPQQPQPQPHSSKNMMSTPLQEFSSLYDYNHDHSRIGTTPSAAPSAAASASSPPSPSPLAKAYLHVLQEDIANASRQQKNIRNIDNHDMNTSSSCTPLGILDVAVVLALSSISSSSSRSNHPDDETTTTTTILAAQSLVDAWCHSTLYAASFFQHVQTLVQVLVVSPVVPFGGREETLAASTTTKLCSTNSHRQGKNDNSDDDHHHTAAAAAATTTDNWLAAVNIPGIQHAVQAIRDQVMQPSIMKLAIFLCLTPSRRRLQLNNAVSGGGGRCYLGISGGGGNDNNNNHLLDQQVQAFWIQLYDALGKQHHDDDNNDHGWEQRQQQQGLVNSLLKLLIRPLGRSSDDNSPAMAGTTVRTTANVHRTAASTDLHENFNDSTAHHALVYRILQDLIHHNGWQHSLLLRSSRLDSTRSSVSRDNDYYFACFVRQSLTQRLITIDVSSHDHHDGGSSTAQLCSVLVLLWGAQEGMRLIQKLLFSSIGAGSNNNNPSLKGLLLATAMVQSNCLRDEEMRDMKEWVLRVLLPVSRRMAEPKLGSQGLAFLLAWDKQQQRVLLQHEHASDLSSKMKTKSNHSNSNSLIFDDIQRLLGNTGLVQTLAHYHQHAGGRQANCETAILGYRATHKLFEDHGPSHTSNSKSSSMERSPSKKTNGVVAAREMVFGVAFFLRHMDSHEPNRWQHAARWVFDLVNTYLQIGREKAKSRWVPYGWLQAAVEFPKIEFDFCGASFVTSKQRETVTSWLQLELFTFEVDKGENVDDNDASSSESKRAFCAELFTRDVDADKMARLRDAFYQYTFGLYIAIGLSSAVLRNVFAHFENLVSWSTTTEDFSDVSNSLLRLVACQILKLYDLRQKTTSTDLLLSSLESALKRQRAKRTSANSTAPEADGIHSSTLAEDSIEAAWEVALNDFALVRSEIAGLEEVFFSSSQFIDERILWECLNNRSHDELLRRNLRCIALSGSMCAGGEASQFSLVLDLNERLVVHLCSSSLWSEPFLVQYMAKAVSMTMFLVETLPKIKSKTSVFSTDIPLSSIDKLAHSYLDLAATSLARCLDMGMGNTGGPGCKISQSCLEAVADVLQNEVTPLQKCSNVLEQITALLHDVDDFPIAGGLLDIMFLLASASRDEAWMTKAVEASFIVLHMRYTQTDTCCSSSKVPYAVVDARRQMKASSDAQQILHIALDLTIGKSSSGCFGMHRFNLMRHFGLLVVSNFEMLEDHLNHFIVELESVVDSIGIATEKDRVEKRNWAESCNTLRPQYAKEETLSRNTKVDGPLCRSKSKKSISPSRSKSKKTATSSIACLDEDTFAEFFEAILDMSVASCILLPPATKNVEESSRPCGPYCRLGAAAQFFRRLIKIYSDGFAGFPRKSMILVFQAGRQMLDVMVCQLEQCVGWRRSQPLPKTSLAIAYDPGSKRYLGDLLDVLATCVVGSLFAMCQTWQNQSSAAHVLSKAKALRQLAEKARRVLVNVALTHKLPLPRFDREAEYVVEAASAAAAVNKNNKPGASSRNAEVEENELLYSPHQPTGEGKKRRRLGSSRIPMNLLMRSKLPKLEPKTASTSTGKLRTGADDADGEADDDEDDDFVLNRHHDAEESSDDKEGSFGAMGDWGDDGDDANGTDDSSSSSTMDAPTISIQRVS